jgi:hypothetical protein
MQEATTGNSKFLQIYNPTSNTIALSGYFIGICTNGCATDINSASTTTAFAATWSFPSSHVLGPGALYTICHADLGQTGCNVHTPAVTHGVADFNGNDFRALCSGSAASYTIVDQIGIGSTTACAIGARTRTRTAMSHPQQP